MKIAPSLLGADFSKLAEEIKEVEKYTEILHLDVMDNHFVPNISFGPQVIKDLRKKTKMIFDTHLMIESPEDSLNDYIEAGSDFITIHYEATKDACRVLEMIKMANKKAGISLKPKTKVEDIKEILSFCDLLLIMTVEPGFGGQKFMEEMISKIIYADNYRKKNNLDFLISVDGGINSETIKKVKNLGLDIVVSGSYIFKAENKELAIKNLLI